MGRRKGDGGRGGGGGGWGVWVVFFFQAEDGIRDHCVTGVQTCALPISTEGLKRLWFQSFSRLPTWSHKVDHGSRRKHGELCGVLNYIINHFNGVNLPVWQMTDPKHMGDRKSVV